MAGIAPGDGGPVAGELAVREPRQRRTREQWDRILDAGVQLLEDDGYEGFTIAALCERAGVAPPALYARAATKDALFLAVYERGMSRVLADHHVFAEPDRWELDTDSQLVEQAVRYLVRIFLDHAAFLRAVVLISGAHPEVRRRGEAYRNAISELFTTVLTPLEPSPLHSDQGSAHEFCFSLVFSAMVLRTAYGPGFGPAGDADALAVELVIMAQRYVVADPPRTTAERDTTGVRHKRHEVRQ